MAIAHASAKIHFFPQSRTSWHREDEIKEHFAAMALLLEALPLVTRAILGLMALAADLLPDGTLVFQQPLTELPTKGVVRDTLYPHLRRLLREGHIVDLDGAFGKKGKVARFALYLSPKPSVVGNSDNQEAPPDVGIPGNSKPPDVGISDNSEPAPIEERARGFEEKDIREEEIPPSLVSDTSSERGAIGGETTPMQPQQRILDANEKREFYGKVKAILRTFPNQRSALFGIHEENIVSGLLRELQVDDGIEDPHTLFLDFLEWTNVAPYDSSKLPIWDKDGLIRRPHFCRLFNLLDNPKRLRAWLGDVMTWVEMGRPIPQDPSEALACQHEDLILGPGTRQECRACHKVLKEEQPEERWVQPSDEFAAFKDAMMGKKLQSPKEQ